MPFKREYEGEYFKLFEVAEGVYAAIETDKKAGSNAGFIDLGGRTVIFDTFLDIDAARELQHIGREFTGRDAFIVVNSHSHFDHITGNCVFPEHTIILSSEFTREGAKETQNELESERSTLPEQIIKLSGLLQTVRSDMERANLENELLYLTRLDKPGVSIRLPDITIDHGMTLYGVCNSVQLTAHDLAHSPGDVTAVLPERKVCFMGDLLFAAQHPWLGDGDPDRLMGVLRDMAGSDIECFIPGHGPLASKADVLLQIQYMEEVKALVLTRGSTNEKDYSNADLSPAFQWQEGHRFMRNIRFFIDKYNNDKIT